MFALVQISHQRALDIARHLVRDQSSVKWKTLVCPLWVFLTDLEENLEKLHIIVENRFDRFFDSYDQFVK